MQTRRSRYSIHYPPGACGDFLAACMYMLHPLTPDENWKKHTLIDNKGKVFINGLYQFEFEGFLDNDDEVYPKGPILRHSNLSIEDYLIINSVLNSKEYNRDTFIEIYNSIYKHINTDNKYLEIASSHVVYTFNTDNEMKDMFLEWSNKFEFDKQFYIHFDSTEEAIEAYAKYLVKDTDDKNILNVMDPRKLGNTFKYFKQCLKTQDKLNKLGMIGIPYNLLKQSNHVKIARYLSRYMDVQMGEQYIHFVDTYKRKNKKHDEDVNNIKSSMLDQAKTYIDKFENIQKGMQK